MTCPKQLVTVRLTQHDAMRLLDLLRAELDRIVTSEIPTPEEVDLANQVLIPTIDKLDFALSPPVGLLIT